MKKKQSYVCDACGYESPAWFGKCPSCGEWNTAVTFNHTDNRISQETRQVDIKPLSDVSIEESPRLKSGMEEFDRSIGGGIVPGSAVLISGEPGIGKSTFMLQLSNYIARDSQVLYVSGEESPRQLKMRADRLGLANTGNIHIMSANDITFIRTGDISRYALMVFDSLQTLKLSDVPSLPGSIVQVRECANALVSSAKSSEIPVFIVSHVTKGGQIAGPKLIEHLVDTVLYFEASKTGYRFLRTVKNRFGPSDEIAVFEMTSSGLKEIADISSVFVEDFVSSPGNIIAVISEGSRAFLVEIQALVSRPIYGTPRRLSTGVPLERVLLVAAVLTKRANIPLDSLDLYVNVAGGLQIEDTGVDLAVATALISSFTDTAIPDNFAVFGELGLDGKVRSVSSAKRRLDRVKNSPFNEVISPEGKNGIKDVKQLLRLIGGIKSGEK